MLKDTQHVASDERLDPQLLDLLCCPSCKGDVVYEPSTDELSCDDCQFVFPVIDGIPVMFPCNVKEKLGELFDRHWDPEDMADLYDEHVEGGQSLMGKYMHVGEVSSTLEVVGKLSPCRLIDCGCGNGRFFEEWPPGLFVVGLDASLNMLRICRRKGRCKRLVCCELEHLPLKDETFDRIICVRVLQHLVHQREAVGEMARICRPEGEVVVHVYNNLSSKGLVKWVRESRLGPVLNFPFRFIRESLSPFGPWPLEYDKYSTAPQLKRWLKQSGLTMTELRGTGFGFNKWFLGEFWIAAWLEKRSPKVLKRYLDYCLYLESHVGQWWLLNQLMEKFVIKGKKGTAAR